MVGADITNLCFGVRRQDPARKRKVSILSNRFGSCNAVCFGHRSGGICRYLSLYRANREVSKVSLQIIFVCRSETGLLALVCKDT